MLGYKSFSNPKYSGGTGPVLVTSAVLAGLGPIASTAAGNYMERRQERILNEQLPLRKGLSDEQARSKFERLANLLASDDASSSHGKIAAELIHF